MIADPSLAGPGVAPCVGAPDPDPEAVHLAALVAAGAEALLDNARGVRLRLVRAGARAVPIAVCPGGEGRAACLSPTAHYLDYPIHELGKRARFWRAERLRPALAPLRLAFRAGDLDRVLYVNHRLTVGAPPLDLARSDLAALVSALTAQYPEHALVFSNVVPVLAPGYAASLRAVGCALVPSRCVWLYDSARPRDGKRFANTRALLNRQRRELQALAANRLDGAALRPHVARIHELYRQLYLGKHSALNPQYTQAFFRLMVDSPLVRALGWVGGDGALEAFHLQIVHGRDVIWSAHGYDLGAPKSRRLNQILAADNIELADALGGVLNWGGGAGEFKRLRSALPAQEFDAVYAAHLPPWRRAPWALLRRLRRPKAPVAMRVDGDGGQA